MKLEILKKRNAVEIHQANDDGSVTVWVCENEQAAMFKLATLVFSKEETPEQAKRSILVGTFSKKKAEPKRPDLEDIARQVAEEFAKNGLKFQKVAPSLDTPDEDGPLVPSILPYTNPYGGQIVGITYPSTTIGGAGSGDQPTIDVNVLGPNGTSGKSSGGDVDVNQILGYMGDLDKVEGCFGIVDTPLDGEDLVDFTGTYQGSNVQAFHTTINMKKTG